MNSTYKDIITLSLLGVVLNGSVELVSNLGMYIEKLGNASIGTAHFTYAQGSFLNIWDTFLIAGLAHFSECISKPTHLGDGYLYGSHVHYKNYTLGSIEKVKVNPV